MAASGDITVAQDGDHGNVKLHPYLVTLVRWCVSCLWSTATVLLHRLMITPLQPITGPKSQAAKPRVPKRVAGTEHLHPEPKVECQILHQPQHHTMDVIFVHGLYGSLGNTWRQGDWRQKYITHPEKVTLRDHSTPNSCNCRQNSYNSPIYNENKCNDNITDLNDPEMSLKKMNEKLSKKVIPEENDLITEQFYNNTLQDQVDVVDNYDTQAKFVSDLFKKETDCDNNICENNENICKNDNESKHNKDSIQNKDSEFKCKYNGVYENNECKCDSGKVCEMGCGCICNDCYSSCWPKDWIKVDYPGARVIAVNYTSDPYLWRPLWIKENKRLNLYQRAEQMIDQLLEMNVGEKPIIWVGHSKGGLFIKQIYCEAYDAYMKANKNPRTNVTTVEQNGDSNQQTSTEIHNGITADNIDTIIGHFSHKNDENNSSNNNLENKNNYTENNCNYTTDNGNLCMENNNIYTTNNVNNKFTTNNGTYTKNKDNPTANINNYTGNNDNYIENNNYTGNNDNYRENKGNYTGNNDNYTINNIANNTCVINGLNEGDKSANKYSEVNAVNDNLYNTRHENGKLEILRDVNMDNGHRCEDLTSNIEEPSVIRGRASLWRASRGFMFYSVPHRGSPLADIKTPVTARSVDLLEIAKDCPLVVGLHERWSRAVQNGEGSRVSVRSFVETCRTLMSVLWLRIVSADSADAGIGTLFGISVDHREICKPSSRSCLLYTELKDLIHEALQCKCH